MDFLVGEYYSLLFIIILIIFCVIVVIYLIVCYVDKGVMVYLLVIFVFRV